MDQIIFRTVAGCYVSGMYYIWKYVEFRPNAVHILETKVVSRCDYSERVERQVREILPTTLKYNVRVIDDPTFHCIACVSYHRSIPTIYIDINYIQCRTNTLPHDLRFDLSDVSYSDSLTRGVRDTNERLQPLNSYYMGKIVWHEHGHIYYNHRYKRICVQAGVYGVLTALNIIGSGSRVGNIVQVLSCVIGKILTCYYKKYQEYQADMYAIDNVKKHSKALHDRASLLDCARLYRGLWNNQRKARITFPRSFNDMLWTWIHLTDSFGEWFNWLDPFRTHPPKLARIRYLQQAYFSSPLVE